MPVAEDPLCGEDQSTASMPGTCAAQHDVRHPPVGPVKNTSLDSSCKELQV